MGKIHLVGIGIILLVVIGCAQLFWGIIINLGADSFICSQVADISADTNGDGIVDIDGNGNGYIDENDQESYDHTVRLFNICRGIVGIVFQTAAGTIEVHNADTGQWVVLTRTPEQFNLLELQGKQQAMVYKEIAPGKYDKLRIDLEKVEVVTRNKRYTTIMPSKELIFDIDMVVERNKKSVIELKIDLANSLHLSEEGEIIFTPVVDVKSKKNAQVQVVDQAKKLVKTLSATTVDSKIMGMDLDGSIKKEFKLDKNRQLTIKDSRVVVKEVTKNENKITIESPRTRNAPARSSTVEIVNPENREEGVTQASEETINQVSTQDRQLVSNDNQQVYDREITLQAKRWLFRPNRIQINEGETVRLRIVPDGALTFIFSVPSLGIEQQISGITFAYLNEPRTGTYSFECSSCEDWRGMSGTLEVGSLVPDSSAAQPLTIPSTGTIVTPPQNPNYSNVLLSLNDVRVDWKGTWGKITNLDYSIKNNEATTIQPSYFIMLVEGYDTEPDTIPKRINLPASSQSISAGESYSLIVNVPLGFAYNAVTAGDLTSVDITLKLYDGGDREMVSVKKLFNLQG